MKRAPPATPPFRRWSARTRDISAQQRELPTSPAADGKTLIDHQIVHFEGSTAAADAKFCSCLLPVKSTGTADGMDSRDSETG